MLSAQPIRFTQMSQFDLQNRGLNAVHPAVPSDHGVMVFANLAMIPKNFHSLVQVAVIGNDRARFPEGPKVFPRVKTKASYISNRTGFSPIV